MTQTILNPESLEIKKLIEMAIGVARIAHKGQYRRDCTTPYFSHVEAVAAKVEDRLKPIALLHDTAENSDLTIAGLELFFPKYITEAIDAITKRKDEDYFDYLKRVKANPDALAVKFADIEHNLSSQPTKKQREKYSKALEFLKS